MNSGLDQYGEIFVGRQPILGPTLKTVGYKVLYRNCEIGQTIFTDESVTTAKLLLNTYLDIGIEHIVGSHLAFLNISKKFLLEQYCEALPKNLVVLEILEDVEPTDQVLEALEMHSKQGYTIALDGFVYDNRTRPFLEFVDIVKIDVLGKSENQLQREIAPLRESRISLLAENVDTVENYEICKKMGFLYFQGYFFFRLDVIREQEIPANRVALLELLGKIQDPHIPFKGLIEHIRNDLSLSFKVLQYVNSASVGLSKRVDSIDHAANMVGIERIRTWATLIMMASGQPQAHEILVISLVRAKMCEQLGTRLGADAPEKFFTMGLLSVLEALYLSPMECILEKLPLPNDIADALVFGTGELGVVLSSVKAYEEGQWMELKPLRLEPSIIRDCYLDAIDWANHFSPLLI